MRKRRSTVPVTPGKDVTLYVPSDTPPEVIDYMNRLKAEGMFSQGVMDILTRHILLERPGQVPKREESVDDTERHYEDEPVYITELIKEPEPESEVEAEEEAAAPIIRESFSLDQIFLQAVRNTGKLKR
ncbi:hypothetical protein [Paenibacillus thermotolerans]|uniref:hypothetical protein n=1 Tax=Paenibacillus thermotolerans TaxID=3027807 RepID=UPI0023677F41|nr:MULTISPECIES: hypothetical protein [unclassified Paenibacillus]